MLRCTVQFQGDPRQMFSYDDQRVLEVIAGELGAALERRQMERFREITLAGAAHQMEAPISAAMAALRDLEAAPHLSPDDRAQYLKDANDWMAESLKRFAMIRSWEKVRTRTLPVTKHAFRLRRMFEELHEQRRHHLKEEGISFRISCPASLTVRADRRLVLQIFENLIDNAFYFTQDRIEVRCRRLVSGDTRIEVRDNGPGLTAHARQNCFEPRFTTRSERRGTEGLGLGLAIARELARLQGGDVRCGEERAQEQRPGGIFIVLLPMR